MWIFFLLNNGMKLRSERTAALRDVRKQASIIWQPLYVCAQGTSYPKLSSYRKWHFHSGMCAWDKFLLLVGTSPVATGGFWVLSPPNKAPGHPKLNYEALWIGGVFIKLHNVKPPWTDVKSPFENFLVTALVDTV